MGKLSHLTSGVQDIRRKLESAEMGEVGNLLDENFTKVNRKLEKSLNSLISQANQYQDRAFTSAVQQAVLGVTQSQQIILNALSRITEQVLESSHELREELKGEVEKVDGNVGSVAGNLAGLIDKLAKSVERLPTAFPEQVKTDLSNLEKGLLQLELAIKEIPMPEMPKSIDIRPQLSGLEKKLGKRVHTFKIERGKDNLIHTITVVTK